MMSHLTTLADVAQGIRDVRVGDLVLAATPDGRLVYDAVMTFGHRKRSECNPPEFDSR
jgi:hypothetical protein